MPLTPDEIEAERTHFEAWWLLDVLGFPCDPTYIAGYGYALLPMQRAWQAWLAAIESERERVRKEQDAAEALTEKLGRFWPSGERAE